MLDESLDLTCQAVGTNTQQQQGASYLDTAYLADRLLSGVINQSQVASGLQCPQLISTQDSPCDLTQVFSTTSIWCLNNKIGRFGEHPVACGGYADVWMGSYGSSYVAIKVMRPFASSSGRRIEPKKLLKRLWHEFRSWSCLHHENVISCLGFSYDFSPDTKIPSLISPWMANGTVKGYIEAHPDVDRLELLLGISQGLTYMHNRNPAMVHGDLRADNVLVSDCGIPRISDFGLSKMLSQTGGATTSSDIAGSLRWMSPELLRNKPVSVGSDVWAYGMTVLEVLSGDRPWQETKFDHMVLRQLIDGQIPLRPNAETYINDDVWLVCRQCWTQKESQRPSMTVVTSRISALLTTSRVADVSTRSNMKSEIETSSLSNPPERCSERDRHAFRLPSGSDSRGPCPALNTLANHGYLPHDGHNIWPEDLLAAIKSPETYHISDPLARVLVYGGLSMILKPPPISLHELTRRGLLQFDDDFLTLEEVARRQLINFNPDLVHQQMSLAEWALVLEVFGKAHGGKVPSDALKLWLTKNQFPEGWRPTHEQGLTDLILKSNAVRQRMNERWNNEKSVQAQIWNVGLTET